MTWKIKALVINKYIRVNVRHRAFKCWLAQTSGFVLLATVAILSLKNSEKSPGTHYTGKERHGIGIAVNLTTWDCRIENRIVAYKWLVLEEIGRIMRLEMSELKRKESETG